MKLPVKYVKDELDLPYGGNVEKAKIIDDAIIGNGRWHITHRLIVEIEGKTYETYYSVGSTEYQDESPWEYETEVEFTPVVPVVVNHVKYLVVCEKHPKYQAKRAPRSNCERCIKMWEISKGLK